MIATAPLRSTAWKNYLKNTAEHLTTSTQRVLAANPSPSWPPIRLLSLEKPSDLAECAVGCDSDIGGASNAALDTDAEGKGRFWGTLRTSVPEEWKRKLKEGESARSGYAGFRTKTKTRLFGVTTWDTSMRPYLALRVRENSPPKRGPSSSGYFVNIQVRRPSLFQHRLFLRTPGEWETVVVPLDNFVLTNSGQTVKKQIKMMREKIRTVGISILADAAGGAKGRREREEGFELGVEWIEAWPKNELERRAKVESGAEKSSVEEKQAEQSVPQPAQYHA